MGCRMPKSKGVQALYDYGKKGGEEGGKKKERKEEKRI